MKKKVIAALLAGAMLVTGIAGCSAGGSSESGSETTADGKTKLTALFVSHSATKDVEEMKENMHKVQCVIPDPKEEEILLKELQVLQYEKRLSLLTMVVRGEQEEIMKKIQEKHPLFAEALPLTLEEIFISETEVAGYDIKKLFA